MKPIERLSQRRVHHVGCLRVVLTAVMLVTGVACDREAESLPSVAAGVPPFVPAPGRYVLDPDHSFIYFAAQHMVVGRVRGRFNTMKGTALSGSDPQSSQVDVVIDAASVDTQNDPRDAHLRGPDFFDVQAFPTIEYHGSSFRRNGANWLVDGALTIHGVTRNVPLELVFKGTAPRQEGTPRRVAVQATASVKRADFRMTRGLLNEIGAVSAKPDVWIEIDAEFLAQEQSSDAGEPAPQSKPIVRR